MKIDELIDDLKKFMISNGNCDIFVEIEDKEACYEISRIEEGFHFGVEKKVLTVIVK